MIRRFPSSSWPLVAALAVASAGCGPGSRSYELRGQVLGVDTARQEILIKHEAVPGLMAGMTMPFKVQRPALLEGRRPGDLVSARLVVRGADAALASLDTIGFASIDTDGAVFLPPLLQPGEAVPPQPFLDQDGHPRTFSAWQGQAVAITFIYTRCPIPTFCPWMDRQFAAIQRAVRARASLRHQVHLVSITLDPQYDTPAVLKAHAQQLDADPAMWTFLTGEPDDIRHWSERFGVTASRTGTAGGDVVHNLRTAVLDKTGRLVKIYDGTDWTPQQVLGDLAAIVAGS
jgi:protein SCO1